MRLWLTALVGVVIGLSLGSVPAVAADDGAQIFQQTCAQCHTKDQRPLEDKRLTLAEWKEVVKEMGDLGATLPTGDQLRALYDYLVRSFGR